MDGMSTEITAERRRQLAAATGTNEQYLYQCLTGRRDMNPGEARRLETATAGELHRWNLCQKTWHRIWPELVDTEGAPPAPTVEPAASEAKAV